MGLKALCRQNAGCFFHAQKGVVILREKKICFSKWLLIADYVVFFLLLYQLREDVLAERDATFQAAVVSAWVVQLGASSAVYYLKAKAENLLKLAIQMLKDLPEDMKERADPNQIIASVLGLKD